MTNIKSEASFSFFFFFPSLKIKSTLLWNSIQPVQINTRSTVIFSRKFCQHFPFQEVTFSFLQMNGHVTGSVSSSYMKLPSNHPWTHFLRLADLCCLSQQARPTGGSWALEKGRVWTEMCCKWKHTLDFKDLFKKGNKRIIVWLHVEIIVFWTCWVRYSIKINFAYLLFLKMGLLEDFQFHMWLILLFCWTVPCDTLPWGRRCSSHLKGMNISHYRNSTPAESHNDLTLGPSALKWIQFSYIIFLP